MELGLEERIDLGKTKRGFKEGAGLGKGKGAGLDGKGGTGFGITGRGWRKGKELGKGSGARLEARCGSERRDRIWGGAAGCWGVKGLVYGKMGFRYLEPCRLAEKCIRATVCRVGDDLRTGLCQGN